jgi:hypothetical protein
LAPSPFSPCVLVSSVFLFLLCTDVSYLCLLAACCHFFGGAVRPRSLLFPSVYFRCGALCSRSGRSRDLPLAGTTIPWALLRSLSHLPCRGLD